MNPVKAIRWGLLVLLLGTIAAYLLFEHIYQTSRKTGWITYFSAEMAGCAPDAADIRVDRQQRLWLLASPWRDCPFLDSAHVFDGQGWTELNIGRRYGDSYEIDDQGRLWRLRDIKGAGGRASSIDIAVFTNGQWSTYIQADERITGKRGPNPGLAIDKDGRLWLAYTLLPPAENPALWTTGIAVFDGQAWTTYSRNNTPALASVQVYGPKFDAHDQAWFLVGGGGAMLFDGAQWTRLSSNDPRSAPYGEPLSITIDADGNAWFDTTKGFIVSADGSRAINWNEATSIGYRTSPPHGTFQVAFDDDGKVWIANDQEVMVFDEPTWTTLTAANSGLSPGGVGDLAIDGAGRPWIGTGSGIGVLSAEEGGRSPSRLMDVWSWLRSDNSLPVGRYWGIAFVVFLVWYAVLLDTGYRLSATGFLLGILATVPPSVLAILSMLGLRVDMYLVNEVLRLMLVFGTLGVIVCVVALAPLGRQNQKGRKLAITGRTLSIIASVLSGGLHLLAFLWS